MLDLITILWVMFVFLTILAGYSLLRDIAVSDRTRVKQRLAAEFGTGSAVAPSSRLFTKRARAAANPQEEGPTADTFSEKCQAAIDQAGMNTTMASLNVKSLALGVGVGGILALVTHLWAVALVVGGFAAVLPPGCVLIKRRHRLDKMLSQLPDVYSMMARVLRAGQTTMQAMQVVSQEFDEPIKGEFATCYEEQNLGLPMERALRNLAKRTGIAEVQMFVVATLVHQSSGGNLSELLDNLAQVIRERFRLRGLIRSLTAEGRLQAAVLLGLPFFLFVLLYVLNPAYMHVLLEYPVLLVAALVAELLGAVWIRRIINFDF